MQSANSQISTNKKALFDFNISDTVQCGIILKGSEVKSVKTKHSFSLSNSYITVNKQSNKVFLHNTSIAQYDPTSPFDHEPQRTRELLLKKREIVKLKIFLTQRGHTCIPIKAYVKRGLIKLSLGLCSGKKQIDKKKEEKANTILKNIRIEAKRQEQSLNR